MSLISTFVQALALVSFCAALPADPNAVAFEAVGEATDDVCDASDVGCALSLRQLRASTLTPDGEQSTGPATDGIELLSEGTENGVTSLKDSLQKKANIVKAYHVTSPAVCKLILAGGFKPGSKGWCGGAIYFAATIQSVWTKAIGVDSRTGCLLEAKVNMGKIKKMGPKCDMAMTPKTLAAEKYDSIAFNPGDGIEYVIYDPSRVISVKKIWQDPKLSADSDKMAPVRVLDALDAEVRHDDGPSAAAVAEAEGAPSA
jgi:hypothetical protein